ncbi:hypothetical protein A2856_00725 [Candidatus Uhrbacteria bacterium RIFCSPHIGHO2_01_FULL_63_20]|uniref:Uncharacterized protein n=1 Tax=Candidatus Uhrbacteria bacterium RIFCSPHIGHO2_01_FULL_63_20 TaxID=1802385 RepID=A0A1F7TN07_9BACT|nr:MAG: hypothetical protein A2856_00725 [Candidatus Uhrbacteria bacterium RIFCSPHIGHO2_01_FULL_63_20]
MASLTSQMRFTQVQEFADCFGRSGMTPEEAELCLKPEHRSVFDDMLKAMRKHAAFRTDLVHGVFNAALVQLEAFKARCKDKGIDFDRFHFVGSETPPEFTDDPEVVVVLDATLATLQETFEFAWEWTKDGQHDSYRWDGLNTDPAKLRLLEGAEAFEPFTLRWRRVKLDANVGKKPVNVRDPKRSPGVALLFVAAQHPERIKATDYKKRFGFWIPGLQCTVPDSDPWSRAPDVGFSLGDRRVWLSAALADGEHDRWAVPVFLGE